MKKNDKNNINSLTTKTIATLRTINTFTIYSRTSIYSTHYLSFFLFLISPPLPFPRNCKSISCRRFYLHGPHTDCTTEWSYSYTLDLQPDWCYWNGMWGPTLSNNIPIFAYSPWNGRAAMGTDDS